MVATLVRVSSLAQDRDGGWRVEQEDAPLDNFHFQQFDYDGSSGCKGVLR